MAGYSFETKDDMAKSSGRSLNVSMKQAIEICNHVRGRPLSQAKSLLQMAIDMKRPIPLKRFVNGVGHKHGMGPGRYYPKACQQILKVIESAESNAKNKGLGSELRVVHIAAQTAPKQWHYGRKKRSVFKSAHIEVIVQEMKKDVKLKAERKVKADSKTETASTTDNKADNKIGNNTENKKATENKTVKSDAKE